MTTYLGKKNDHMATLIIRNKTKKTYGLRDLWEFDPQVCLTEQP